MMLFAIRLSVYEELLNSPEWSKKLEKAKTEEEIQKVITEFCRAKGYNVAQLKPTTRCSF